MEKLRLSPKERTDFLSEVTNIVDRGTLSQLTNLSGLVTPLDVKKVKKPTIYITTDTMAKMEALVKESPVEISWHGLVKRNKEKGCYLIYDIILFPQINSAAATNTDQEEYAKWLMNIMNDPDESKFDDMRMHGHSHVNMGVYSSGIDDGYQSELLTNIQDGDYYIFLILNKKKDLCALLYDYDQQILFKTTDITIEVVSTDKKSITNWAADQIKEFCKKPEPKPHTTPRYPWAKQFLDCSHDVYPLETPETKTPVVIKKSPRFKKYTERS